MNKNLLPSVILTLSATVATTSFAALTHYHKNNHHSYANALVINLKSHTWQAVNSSGKVVHSGRASGGKNYCPDIGRSCKTPSGTFYIHSIGGAGCKSSRYPVGRGGAKMPYCMFFSKYYAVHGSYEVPNYNASHGCVRVTPSDAYWLKQNFVRIGTKVVIKPY